MDWGEGEGNTPGAARTDWQVKRSGHSGGFWEGREHSQGWQFKGEEKLIRTFSIEQEAEEGSHQKYGSGIRLSQFKSGPHQSLRGLEKAGCP